MARKKATGASEAGSPRITPGKAKNLIKVAQVVGPVVLPVVAPFAARAAAKAQETYDSYRARRLGVGIDELPQFTGKGARQHARIAGVARAATELAERTGATPEDVRFADDARLRLDKLASAVRAAERMPTARRKAANRSVNSELGVLEADLLRRLGVA